MGIRDLDCAASDLPIVPAVDPLCRVIFVAAHNGLYRPILLPVSATWNGNGFDVVDDWRADELRRIFERSRLEGSFGWSTRLGAPKPSLEEATSSAGWLISHIGWCIEDGGPLTLLNEPLGCVVVLDWVYLGLAQAGATTLPPDSAGALGAALSEPLLRHPIYDAAAKNELTRECSDFTSFRSIFEQGRDWTPTPPGDQYNRDEVDARLSRFQAKHPQSKLLARPFEQYRSQLTSALIEDEADEDDSADLQREQHERHLEQARQGLVDHIKARLARAPDISAENLAKSIEVYRAMCPEPVLPDHGTFEKNCAASHRVIERIGHEDVPQLVRELSAGQL